jgi:holo-[acyl-carrier protein] synthase
VPRRTPIAGVDLVLVDEIARAIATFGDRYLHRVYSRAEIAYCRGAEATQAERFAARFAAKEAVLKVLGAPDEGIDWRSIEVDRAADGACSVRLTGRARELARRARIRDFAVSLTHEGQYAAAFVVATRPAGVA